MANQFILLTSLRIFFFVLFLIMILHFFFFLFVSLRFEIETMFSDLKKFQKKKKINNKIK